MTAGNLSYKWLISGLFVLVGCVGPQDQGSLVDGGDDMGTPTDQTPAEPLVSLPDLVESTVADPPTSATLGGTFMESDTVTNSGTASAGASFTKYYLSPNGTTKQYLLGNRSVGMIAMGAMDSGGGTVTVPSGVAQGSYVVLACADCGSGTGGCTSQVIESNETNNCAASPGMVAITGPDLVEAGVSVSPSALSAATGKLTVTDTVQNTGTGAAGASTTRWYLSTDTVKDSSDAFIRNCINGDPVPGRAVGTISAGGNSTGSASTQPLCVRDSAGLHSPATGTYYVIACADDAHQVAETNEGNNCNASSNTVAVTSGADLIETAVSNPPTAGVVGTSFPIMDTVENIGGDPAPSSFTKFYLSTNQTTLNFYLATRSVGGLTAGAIDSATTTATVIPGTTSGTYFVVACADSGPGTGGRTSQIAELNEANNCLASTGTITIASPDIVITTVSNPPATANRGDTFTITDTTSNIGTGDTGMGFFNKYYLSANGTTALYLLAPGAAAGELAPGTNEMVSATGKVPPSAAPGTYWVIDCADSGPGTGGRTSQIVESNENNNCTKSATQVMVN